MKFFVAVLGLLSMSVSTDAGASMHNPFYCYTTDPIKPMSSMLATITSYEATRRFNFTTVNPYVSTCTPSRFWYLGRFGNQIPAPIVIQNMRNFAESSAQDEIIRNYEAGRSTLCRQDYENIRDFTLDSELGRIFTIENALTVTNAGHIAMENIARRFQQVFPTILTQPYTPARYHFRHTGSSWTNSSIRAFSTGLFGEGSANVIYEPVPEADWLLRPFGLCPAYIEETVNRTRQQVAFRDGPEFQEMIEQVNRKLGFHGSNRLVFSQIFEMYNWCRLKSLTFETSNSETGSESPWCAVFSIGHHHLMEYFFDLAQFYSFGYGVRNQRLIENLNCGLMQDLLRHIQSENNADTMARIFISEQDIIQTMMVALGSFRDTWPIHQHNFAQQTGRHWLTSIISPFSANLAVVRFDCDDGDHDLIFLLNERPILVPGCDRQNGVCKLSVIVNRFRRFIDANCGTLFCSSD